MRYLNINGMLLLIFICLLWAMPLKAATDWNEVERGIDKNLAAESRRLEVVYVNGRLSHIEYRPDEREPAPPIPASLPVLDIPWPVLIPYGDVSVRQNGFLEKHAEAAAGIVVKLGGAAGDIRSILPYEKLTIKGDVNGLWTVALSDESLARIDDNAPIGKLENSGETSFPLSSLPPTFDRTKTRYLVLRMEGQQGRLLLSSISFSRSTPALSQPMVAAWLWNSRSVAGKETEIMARMRKLKIKRLYLQIHDDPEKLLPFLKLVHAEGVEVYALDGAPDAAVRPEPFLKRIAAVAAFNLKHPEASFAGFQLDVEPYIQKDFAVRRDKHIERYLALLDNASAQCKGIFPLSVVIPFWFSQVSTTGMDLAQEVIKRADEVVVMAYRRDYSDVLDISTHVLSAGEHAGKPVLLGIEMTPIPDEEHLVLIRTKETDSKSVRLAGLIWKIDRTYKVEGSKLSLAGRLDLLQGMLLQTPPFRSFRGWVIHSLDVMDAAP
jgi:hypothetical protein